MIEIGIGIALVFIVILAVSGKGRTMLKGFSNLFFEDIAKTPKGADAIYSKSIEECEDDYSKASNNVSKIAGMLETSKTNHKNSTENAKNYVHQCETLAKAGRFDDVEIVATELELAKEEIEVYLNDINKYTPMLAQAQQVYSALESKLKKLKKR